MTLVEMGKKLPLFESGGFINLHDLMQGQRGRDLGYAWMFERTIPQLSEIFQKWDRCSEAIDGRVRLLAGLKTVRKIDNLVKLPWRPIYPEYDLKLTEGELGLHSYTHISARTPFLNILLMETGVSAPFNFSERDINLLGCHVRLGDMGAVVELAEIYSLWRQDGHEDDIEAEDLHRRLTRIKQWINPIQEAERLPFVGTSVALCHLLLEWYSVS